MSKFVRTDFSIKRLVDNSFKAIDDGAYETKHSFVHDAISIRKAIISCLHAPLITEVKFSSPSQGKIRSKTAPPAEIAAKMVSSGAIGLSLLTQPYVFEGSVEYLAAIRKAVSVPLLMKDITVSRVQIDAGKKAGADCILLIKTIFDRDMAEEGMEELAQYATKIGLQVLVEVHTEQEFAEVLKSRHALIGINNRNLDNLQVDITNTERLLSTHPKGRSLIISESGIGKPEDIWYLRKVGADAFLVGTSIMETGDIGAKVAELYNSL